MKPRAYTRADLCAILNIPRRSFFHHLKAGHLPMCEELKPRIGRVPRYRADLVDQYVENQFGRPRAFGSHRRSA
jgi:hypothetical protein